MIVSETVDLIVPGSPVGKGRPRFTRTGRSYTPEKTARYENLIALAFQEKYPDWEPWDGEVEMMMTAYFEIPRSWSKKKQAKARDELIRPKKKPDLDNISKMKDALNGIAWKDDAQIVREECEKKYSVNPRLEIALYFGKEEE